MGEPHIADGLDPIADHIEAILIRRMTRIA